MIGMPQIKYANNNGVYFDKIIAYSDSKKIYRF